MEQQKRRSAAWVSVFLGAALVALTPLAASAHDQIVEQSPSHNEHFDTPPTEVVLTFNNEPLDLGNVVMVVDADGNDHAVGEPEIRNFTVSQAIIGDLADGYYQVRWRVVSSDGHPISESFLFSVGKVTDDTPKPSITVTPDAAPDNASASPEDPGTESGMNSALDPADINVENPWRTAFFVLGGTVVAAVIVALTLLARNKSPNRNPEESSQPR